MEGQAVTFNQAFRDRIAGYMKAILIFNACKVASALGALIAGIFIKVNVDHHFNSFDPNTIVSIYPNAAIYALPIAGSAVSLIAAIGIVFVFTSNEWKEHFISNVILYRVVVAVCQLPLIGGFGIAIYYNVLLRADSNQLPDNFFLPIIMFLVFSGLIVFFFGIGSAICMRRIYIIKFFMFLASATAARAASTRAASTRAAATGAKGSNLSAGFYEPRV